ncbi:MAG: alkaline phosphatase family protein [Rubricoccaceae bacterium]|nr:alkaline phosphatase family protein [Rubricoccaceae bacterium]
MFLDGVGLGPASAETNPLARYDYPALNQLAGNHDWTRNAPALQNATQIFLPVDANLDVKGLPQSGTGQASLFSGINCAEIAGRHYGPYPHSTSKPVLAEHNVFVQLRGKDLPKERLVFANAYPERFFVHAWERKRWTVTTLCCRQADVRLRTAADLLEGTAISAGITNERWQEKLDPSVPDVSEAQAARRIHDLSRAASFTLFEYYLTDKIGHEQDMDLAHGVLQTIDAFLGHLLDLIDNTRDLLLISSDHGNIEDLSTKSHTRYPVPLVAYGAGAEAFADATSILDVTPRIVDLVAAQNK